MKNKSNVFNSSLSIYNMKKIICVFLLLLATSVFTFGQDQISISFSKNFSGELVMTVEGHTAPITVKIGDNKITLHVIENKVNLTALGINDLTEVMVESTATEESTAENIEETETAAGAEAASTADAQAIIPPINPSISPNPPLSTPF